MRIDFHRKFKKQYKKLSPQIRKKIDGTLLLFKTDPFNPRLRNHPLSGRMQGKRAISVTGDIRIIFEEYDNYTLVIFLQVGRHGQMYR